jgi:ATP-binding cassette subfamily A (ABC1) protein 3
MESYFGEVELLSEIASEITFGVSKEKRHLFQEFFKDFDIKMDSLGIKSYGISITTLEEVFIAVNEEERSLTESAVQSEQ